MVGARPDGADGVDDADALRAWPARRPPCPDKPTKRGGGGTLKLLWWYRAPVPAGPAVWATGTKEQDGHADLLRAAGRLGRRRQPDPAVGGESPRRDGGLRRAAKSVTWKLKRGVTWHDGQPFTADDVVFNWEFCKDPATAASNIATYRDITGREGRFGNTGARDQFPKADAAPGRALRGHRAA
ncbi:MAG UNVERIFIED_CONTAM: ABC transporter substrate-binding protein [Anaerolineae bacterium]